MAELKTSMTVPSIQVSNSSSTPLVHAPMPDNHPMLAIVGQIANQWAHIEHVLDTIIWRLAEVEAEKGSCITAQLTGAYPRFKAIISLATIRKMEKTLISDLTEMMNKMQGKAEKRNRAVHDAWYAESNKWKAGAIQKYPL
jgi:hypothetical protein